jgi:hypothetical protein
VAASRSRNKVERARPRLLPRSSRRSTIVHAVGRALVTLYETVGPSLADGIRAHPSLRAAARAVLRPLVWLASS